MKKTITLFTCLCSFMGFSQATKDSVNAVELNELVVSARRFAQPKKKMTQQLETLSKKQIEFMDKLSKLKLNTHNLILMLQFLHQLV